MALTDATLDSMANHLATLATHVSLHTANPGSTGASEVSGGSPAYARQAVAWNTSSGGDITLSAAETFDVPAGTTVAYFGLWSAASGGTFRGGGQLSASESYTGQGTYNLTNVTVAGSST